MNEKRLLGFAYNWTQYIAQYRPRPDYYDMQNKLRVTDGPGYLHMKMPQELFTKLSNFFKSTYNTSSMKISEAVPGYINTDDVPMDRIILDEFRDVQKYISDEVLKIETWWTGIPDLQHMSTYGLRLYRRGSTLIHHIDTADSHITSAILNVAQDVDYGKGWPVEVYTGNS